MRRRELLAAALALSATIGIANAAPSSRNADVYAVTLIDIQPDRIAPGAELLTRYLQALRSTKGCVPSELVQQPAPSINHVALITIWGTPPIVIGMSQATLPNAFVMPLQPITASPLDDRLYRRLTP